MWNFQRAGELNVENSLGTKCREIVTDCARGNRSNCCICETLWETIIGFLTLQNARGQSFCSGNADLWRSVQPLGRFVRFSRDFSLNKPRNTEPRDEATAGHPASWSPTWDTCKLCATSALAYLSTIAKVTAFRTNLVTGKQKECKRPPESEDDPKWPPRNNLASSSVLVLAWSLHRLKKRRTVKT